MHGETMKFVKVLLFSGFCLWSFTNF